LAAIWWCRFRNAGLFVQPCGSSPKKSRSAEERARRYKGVHGPRAGLRHLTNDSLQYEFSQNAN
jgi:hypothetical protein